MQSMSKWAVWFLWEEVTFVFGCHGWIDRQIDKYIDRWMDGYIDTHDDSVCKNKFPMVNK